MYKPVIEREHPHPACTGTQRLYQFDNGYGASVVRYKIDEECDPLAALVNQISTTVRNHAQNTNGSYGYDNGTWELAVIKYREKDPNKGFELVYDTGITSDVIPDVEDGEELQEILNKIAELEPASA